MVELKERAGDYFAELQKILCRVLQELDGKGEFGEDTWSREPGDDGEGGGISRVLTRGKIFEKAGVNLARVSGRLTERIARRLEVAAQSFEATGISLVLHPLSPMVPAVHMNLRYIQLAERAWFGGGADLTPYYLYEEDAAHFHRTWRNVCDKHDADYYPRFKKACDEYFYIRHRGEARGVGGIFFDYLEQDPEKVFLFVQEAGRAFLEAYLPIVENRMNESWWDREREWQLIRRGRYVEFNLVYDRGTLFGLETGGRTESIMISMPPLVRWAYDWKPEPGSREEALVSVLKQPKDWV